MIHSLTLTSFSHRCESCGREATLDNDLIAGHEFNHLIITMPACECGAVEFLNRTYDNPSYHALCVNSLHEHLVQRGQIHEAHRERLTAETDADKPTNRSPLTSEPLVQPEPFDASAFLNGYLTEAH